MPDEWGSSDADIDNLLRPTLQDQRRTGERPWRVESQVYVGFFGGPLAIGAIAFLNSERLGVPGNGRVRIAAITATVLLLGLVAVYAIVDAGILTAEDGVGGLRLVNGIGGVVAYPFLARVQRSADRVFRFQHEDEDYASLWGPGFVAAFLGAIGGVLLASLALDLAQS